MRHIIMDRKLNEKPQPTTASFQTDNPTPISLKGLWLQNKTDRQTCKLTQLKITRK